MSDYTLEQLLFNITQEQLQFLRENFTKSSQGLKTDHFIALLQQVFEKRDYTEELIEIYLQIDDKGNGVIFWNDFLDFLIKFLKPPSPVSFTCNVFNISNPPHVKRETIVKIVLLKTEKYFSYAILAKYGHVGIYDGNMNFLFSYQTIMCRADIDRKEEDRRRRNRWITDAIFLENLLLFAITTSARSITIYDASGLKHTPLWLILSVPYSIQCLTYAINEEDHTTTVFLGNEIGTIISMKFLKPKDGLFKKRQNEKITTYYWTELQDEKLYVSIDILTQIHREKIKMINYFPDNNTLVTCSKDPQASVMITYTDNRLKPYIFKMKLGASCFSLSRTLKILITGSDDGVIRLWSTFNVLQPLDIFRSEENGIVDVQILEKQKMFISCSREGILKLWNIEEEKCIQKLELNFPAFQILGNFIEWGTKSIYPGPNRTNSSKNQEDWEVILISCCNYIATINLNDTQNNFEFENSILPPFPLQHSVLIPKDWGINLPLNLEKFPEENVDNDKTDNDTTAINLESLKFILDRDLLSELNIQWDIHERLGLLESKKKMMKKSVANCAPYLALDLYDIEEVKIIPDLPIPNRKVKSLVEKTERMLSAASTRSMVFSETTSSSNRTKSSRSSVVSFN